MMKIKIKNSKPLISIIMNCYNGERFLKSAIDSVYDQTYKNWEIIFWDNASNDTSSTIARSYDQKVKYFVSNETTNLGCARLLASEKVSGEYIAFLDCDDLWLPHKLENQIKLFETSNTRLGLGLVYGQCEAFYSDTKKRSHILSGGEKLPEGEIFSELAKRNFIPFVSAMVKKSVFLECGGFDNHLKHSPDYALFLNIAHKYPVGALQEICCKYRIHKSNLTNFLKLTAAEESLEIVSAFLPDKLAIEGIKHQNIKLILALIREKRVIAAVKIIYKSKNLIMLLKYILRKYYQ